MKPRASHNFVLSLSLIVLAAVLATVFMPRGMAARAAGGHLPACPPGVCRDVELVGQIGGAVAALTLQDNKAYVSVGTRMQIEDITDPNHPVLVGETETFRNYVQDEAVQGNYAYLATGASGMAVVDVSNPAAPVTKGVYDTPGSARAVAAAGSYVYVADREAGLRVIDVANPATPVEVGFYDTPGWALDVAAAGSLVYVADREAGLRVIDVSNPAEPATRGVLDLPDDALAVAVVGNIAYVADAWSGLRLIDVSNPDTPVEVGVFPTEEAARGVAVVGTTAYLTDDVGALRVIDVANPAAPKEIGTSDLPNYPFGVAAAGSRVLVADYYLGVRLFDVTDPAKPAQTSMFATTGYGWGMAVADQKGYFAAGVAGLRILDLSDPARPVEIGGYATPAKAWNVAVAGKYAYVAEWDGGVQVLDVSDPAAPALLTNLTTPGEAEALVLAGSYAYLAAGTAGLRVLDISNPASPAIVGAVDTPGDAVGLAVAGHYAYVADGTTGLRIIDVADPLHPVEVGFFDTPGLALGVQVAGAYAYVADGDSGLRVLDVSNPAAPSKVGFYDTAFKAADVVVMGDFAYVADRDDGLRVINVADPANPREWAFYDTPGYARKLVMDGKRAFVVDEYAGLIILDYLSSGPPPTPTPTPTPTGTATPTPTVTPTLNVTPNPIAADPYEPDDQCWQAQGIAPNGASQHHTFDHQADVDWVRFEAKAGVEYVVEAMVPAGSPADLAMEMYGQCDGAPVAHQGETFTADIRVSFTAPADGPLFVKLLNQDPAAAGAEVTYDLTVSAPGQGQPGALILVAGRLRAADFVQRNIGSAADSVYRLFRDHDYGDDRIFYLTSDEKADGFDAPPTRANLQAALLTWAAGKVGPDRPLTIFLVDHGGVDRFYLDEVNGQRLEPADLDAWLSVLEATYPGLKVNVIIESCHSGSFIAPSGGTVAKAGRVVLSSTDVRSLAWASVDGAVFTDSLVAALAEGNTLAASFRQATYAVNVEHPTQRPWLDADGNGVANQQEDFARAGERGFGIPGSFDGNWPPYIFSASGTVTVTDGAGVISADVRDDHHIDKVWAAIYPPSYRPPEASDSLVQEVVPTVVLTPTHDTTYSASHAGFTEPGAYRIVVYAQDNDFTAARPLAITVRNGYDAWLPTLLR